MDDKLTIKWWPGLAVNSSSANRFPWDGSSNSTRYLGTQQAPVFQSGSAGTSSTSNRTDDQVTQEMADWAETLSRMMDEKGADSKKREKVLQAIREMTGDLTDPAALGRKREADRLEAVRQHELRKAETERKEAALRAEQARLDEEAQSRADLAALPTFGIF